VRRDVRWDIEDLRTPTEKDLLRLVQDGPTLQQLVERISQESKEDVPSKSVGEVLVALQNKGYVFLDEGRWWRTPEGVSYLDRILAEEAHTKEKEERKQKVERLRLPAKETWRARSDLIVALAVALVVLSLKVYFSYGYLLPTWDGVIYLLNARRFLYGYSPYSLFELLRPPLLPVMIAILWSFVGENYLAVIPIQPIFTVIAALLLYVVVRRMFDWKTAMLSFLFFLFNPNLFVNTDQLLTHGVQLVFTLLCILFAWRSYSEQTDATSIEAFVYPALVGFFGALTSLTRYPAVVFFPSVLFLALKRDMKRNLQWLTVCACSFIATWMPWLGWNMTYAGGDLFASVKAGFIVGAYVGQPEPWYYYLTSLPQLITVVGVILLLIGIAGKTSFKDPRILTFLGWFALAVGAHSIFVNKQLRFTIEWFPAIAVLMALGVRRIQGLLRLRLKTRALFHLALAAWLVYLAASSTMLAMASVERLRASAPEREFPTVVSWIAANTAKTDIGASDDLFTPHFAYFAKRLFYNFEYLEGESKARGISMPQMFRIVNVSYVVVTSWYADAKKFDKADYLVLVKKFQAFMAYAVLGVASKHLGILIVGNYSKLPTSRPQLSQSSFAIQETIRGIFPRFDTVNPDSFFANVESALAEDRSPKHGLIVLLDELWSGSSQSLSLSRAQLSVLKKLVEEYGVALLTSGNSTSGWLLETRAIKPTGTSTFTSFHIRESTKIPGWSNLLGKDRTWNMSVSSQFKAFSSTPENVESIVETSGQSSGKALVWVGNHGKGKIAYFSCTASDLSFSRRYSTVNPVLIRVLFWLLGDYPRIVKGSTFKVALRIDDAQAALYNSIEKHGSVLTNERHIPISLSVIPKDLTEATATLLLRLRSQGCELTLHGFPGHYDLLTYANQTQALIDGREVFRKWLGFYPTMLVPPGLSYNYETVKAAQALGFKAICGGSFEDKPPGAHANHFGYPFSNSTVTMLPVLSLLDFGPQSGWMPSAEEAIARTKWLLASQRWLRSSCIIEFHFNDTRLPEIARLTDWVKDIGGEFGTLEQLMTDTFMGPALEQYSPYSDVSSFSSFDVIESTGPRAYRISFVLNEPVKLRIDMGGEIANCYVDRTAQEPKGQLIVTDLLEAGKEHIIVIRMKKPST